MTTSLLAKDQYYERPAANVTPARKTSAFAEERGWEKPISKPPAWLGAKGSMGDVSQRPDWYNQEYKDYMAGRGSTYDSMFKSAETQAKIQKIAQAQQTPMWMNSNYHGTGAGANVFESPNVPSWLGGSLYVPPGMSREQYNKAQRATDSHVTSDPNYINPAGQMDPHHMFDPSIRWYPSPGGPLLPWWPTPDSQPALPPPASAPPPASGGGMGYGGGGGFGYGGRGGGGGSRTPAWFSPGMGLFQWNYRG